MEAGPIVNRVASSPLVTLDIEEYLDKSDRVHFDIREALGEDPILREKPFRQFIKDHDWSQYQGKNVLITIIDEMIIPDWANMLIISRLQPYANEVAVGEDLDLEKTLIDQGIGKIDFQQLTNKKVVVKGCGELKARNYAYAELTKKLVPIASSVMYGEPCSTVPVYKKPK